jgi:hypothetical protein
VPFPSWYQAIGSSGFTAGGSPELHSVKTVEVAAMREVCRVRGWEIPVEFSLNPPNSPAVLIHWRALIELLGITK